MVQEFEGRDIGVEGDRFLELLLPFLVNDGHDVVMAGIIGCLVELTVISSCFVFSLCSTYFYSFCILIDRIIV